MTADRWESRSLSDCVNFVSGGTPARERPDYWGGTVPWLSAKDMKQFRVHDTEEHLTKEGVDEATRLVPSGTVLLLTRGMTLLNDVPICVAQREITFNQDVKALMPKPGVEPGFLPYLLLALKPRLLGMVDLAGHGTGRLNTDSLRDLDVLLPTPAIQREIARVFCTLDDKIELNRRMNETLEGVARGIFKSWFVDFDLVRRRSRVQSAGLPTPITPQSSAKFSDSELGRVPADWRVSRLPEAVEYQEGPGILAKDFRDGGVPLIRLEGLKAGVSLLTGCNFLDPQMVAAKWSHFRLHAGDVLLSTSASLGRVGEVREEAVGAIPYTGLIRFRGKEGSCHQRFLRHYLVSPIFQTQVEAMGAGSVLRHFGPTHLKHMYILLPPREVQRKFAELVQPLDAAYFQNLDQCRTLAAIRDALLPKLLSGTIRTKDAERIVERFS